MALEIPSILKSVRAAGGAYRVLTAWRRQATGDGRAVVDEIENNLRYLDLVADGDAALGDVVERLDTREFDRLLRAGFDFDRLRRARIPAWDSLSGSDLAAWQGKSTESLIRAIYRMIKDIRVKYPYAADSPNYRWMVRVHNVRKRCWLLFRHLAGQ